MSKPGPLTATQLVASVPDEDTAMTVMHGLRSRFDWSGTEFIRADVEDHVREALADREGEHPEPTDAEVDALVDAVMASYTYRKLADRFAERGNELLADEARSVVEASSGSRPGEGMGR
jgi:hypothetical protein